MRVLAETFVRQRVRPKVDDRRDLPGEDPQDEDVMLVPAQMDVVPLPATPDDLASLELGGRRSGHSDTRPMLGDEPRGSHVVVGELPRRVADRVARDAAPA